MAKKMKLKNKCAKGIVALSKEADLYILIFLQ